MLIACEECRRQYEVGDFKPGSRVRCVCGQLCKVPKVKPRQVQMLHCSNCGGSLGDGQEVCSYCESTVDRSDRARPDVCPECMCGLAENAKFCNNCGVDIDPESIVRAVTDRNCPRCKEPLVLSTSEKSSFYQCTACAGLWLDRENFETLLAKREADAEPRPKALPGHLPKSVFPVFSHKELHQRESDPQVNLRCPTCRRVMARKRFAHYSAVYIDECFSHGFWFDEGEIQEILDIVAVGGLAEAREKQERSERRRRQRSRRRSRERDRSGRDFQHGLLGELLMVLFHP